jgi:hypothetical protein
MRHHALAILLGVLAVVAADAACAASDDWWAPDQARVLPPAIQYPDPAGTVTTLHTAGPTQTRAHPFFASSTGRNGRACVTCHQPADGMSLSLETIRARWRDTQGKDPLFAMIDGANCPDLPPLEASSHSLLLERGLFRIARPWPPVDPSGTPIEPQFTLEIVRDPPGCNVDPEHGIAGPQRAVSVYRRPRPATSVKYLTAAGFPFEPKTGLPLPTDPETGELVSGNLLSDARAPSLPAQVRDAMRTHLSVRETPDASVVRTLVEFLGTLYTAQSAHSTGGALDEHGAEGGPAALAQARAGELHATSRPVWGEFAAWREAEAKALGRTPEQRAFRASVARGAELFWKRTFLVSDTAPLNNMGFGNPVRNGCAFCHNMLHTGLDVAPGQVDLGTTNFPASQPDPELPLFKLTCDPRFLPHPYLGRVVYTQDPGYALTTGKCIDIGKITAQSMRALSARAPYFANGSARTLREVVDFYDRRYGIGFTDREKQDLVNLMSVL